MYANICIIGVSESEEIMRGKNLSEDVIAENFPNLGKKTNIQVPEAQSSKQDAPKDIHIQAHFN